MQIARPPTGFKIRVEAPAQSTLDGVADAMPRVAGWWKGVCDRLKVTAHAEGQILADGDTLMQLPGTIDYGIPTIAIRYRVLGDTVTIKRLYIAVS